MINTYKKHLYYFFEKLLYYRHINGRIDKVFQKDIKVYSSEEAIIEFISALVISDWTGPTDNGWEINFPTCHITETNKENYETEIRKFLSKQLCLLYAQSFESFERYLKNCLFERIVRDDTIKAYAISLYSKKRRPSSITRENMLRGDGLFKVLKKAGGKSFNKFSSNNNLNIKFKELWTILSEVRHSITHRESLIEKKKVNKSSHHFGIFNYLFNSKNISDDLILIELTYGKFDNLIKRFSEFAFQIFKLLSIEENLEWKDSE